MTPPCRWTPGLDVEWLSGAELEVGARGLSLHLGGIDVTAILRSRVSAGTLERLAGLVRAGEEPVAPVELWWALIDTAREPSELLELEEPGEIVLFG